MENTQGIWILYGVFLTLHFLNANIKKLAAKRHLVIETAKLHQPKYFQNVLTSN